MDLDNTTNSTLPDPPLDCPQFSNETAAAIETFAYWYPSRC
jgi:hypothetical protein